MPDIKVLTVGSTGDLEEFNLQPTLDGKSEITGFPVDANGDYLCTLSYNETTRTVTITPTGATFDIFLMGDKYTFTGVQSIVHGTQQGVHFIYFDATGVLVTSQVPWDLMSNAPVCYVFRDAISGLSIAWEERHHAGRDLYWHKNQHFNEGTKARSGFAISGYVLNSSTSNADITYAIASGIVDDEDIAVTTQALPDNGPYTVMRRSGAAGDWVIDRTPVLPFLISGSDVAYNQYTGATWQLTATSNNRFVNYYVLATTALPSTSVTPASANQYILIPGQAVFNSLSLARAELITALQWGDIPFQEVAPLYRVTFQRSNGWATSGRCRIAAVSRIVGTYVQVTQATNPQHGSLGGLDADDHAQYPILSSGSVPPTSTPARVGALYVDTAAPALYVGKGIASAADWAPVLSHPAYAHASLPAASSAPVGMEVWNTTYNVLMRSNGTRWIPMGSFRVYAVSSDVVVPNTQTETEVASFVLPAGLLGTGLLKLRAHWTYTDSGNIKTFKILFGGSALMSASGYLNTLSAVGDFSIRNLTESSQIGSSAVQAGTGTTSGALVTAAIDTTVDVTVQILMKMNALGESMTLKSLFVELCP